MVEFQFRSKDRAKVAALSYTICDGFAGWPEFVNNTVVVTPETFVKSDKHPDGEWACSVVVGPDNTGHNVTIHIGDNISDMRVITENPSIVEMYNDASVGVECKLPDEE